MLVNFAFILSYDAVFPRTPYLHTEDESAGQTMAQV